MRKTPDIILCFLSTPGFYCDYADRPVTDYSPYPCPMGYYCPNGTEYAQQHACPAGTYNPDTMLEAENECTQCDAGKFCAGVANTVVDGDCTEGFWCILGEWFLMRE